MIYLGNSGMNDYPDLMYICSDDTSDDLKFNRSLDNGDTW